MFSCCESSILGSDTAQEGWESEDWRSGLYQKGVSWATGIEHDSEKSSRKYRRGKKDHITSFKQYLLGTKARANFISRRQVIDIRCRSCICIPRRQFQRKSRSWWVEVCNTWWQPILWTEYVSGTCVYHSYKSQEAQRVTGRKQNNQREGRMHQEAEEKGSQEETTEEVDRQVEQEMGTWRTKKNHE